AYAQEAVSLGVKEYIVKPASREQIEATLRRIVAQLEQDRARRETELDLLHRVSQLEPIVENELALSLMVDQVQAADTEALSEWLAFPLDRGCALIAAFPKQVYENNDKEVYIAVRSFAKTNPFQSVVSSLIDRHMTVFFRLPVPSDGGSQEEEIEAFGNKLAALLLRQFGVTASIGIGTTQERAAGFRTSYFEAVFASTFVGSQGGVSLFEKVARSGERPSAALLGGSGGVEQRSYVVSALQRIREERERRTLSVLDRAKQYIADRYTSDISLEEAAGHVHLHPQYFSKLFKQQTGESFTDYVTRLRIEKAKTLIASGSFSLKEICFEIGYKDPNYFSRVFKKVTGFTPTEYREAPNRQ
ncbi:MAG TPA: AraC family transcriptional regulator, partial [Paenibacillus sp.]|nr:AraC family transcriptional regulator [Paenibacillus sp.]